MSRYKAKANAALSEKMKAGGKGSGGKGSGGKGKKRKRGQRSRIFLWRKMHDILDIGIIVLCTGKAIV